MRTKTKEEILKLALDITKSNVEKGNFEKKKKYVNNKAFKPKFKNVKAKLNNKILFIAGDVTGKKLLTIYQKNGRLNNKLQGC
tara:strand:- start:351 stop:599 length:249 start_codon:yes stop_codon:yes gene_type:complete